MSALSNFFQSMANAIRAKTGKAAKLTPNDMIEEIAEVYEAGENAGIVATKVGTATASDVLNGKTFTNSSSVGETGEMTNQGAKSFTITNTSAVPVPRGYYNGSGTIQTSGMMVVPSASLSITKDGTYDVTNYANATVSTIKGTIVMIVSATNSNSGLCYGLEVVNGVASSPVLGSALASSFGVAGTYLTAVLSGQYYTNRYSSFKITNRSSSNVKYTANRFIKSGSTISTILTVSRTLSAGATTGELYNAQNMQAYHPTVITIEFEVL